MKYDWMKHLWFYDGELEAMPGSHIEGACMELATLASIEQEPVSIDFNGITVTAAPGDSTSALVGRWQAEWDRRREAYLASPEYADAVRKREEAEAARCAARDDAEACAPGEPQWSDPSAWQRWVDANQDGYGGACVAYATRWARFMEGAMESGQSLEDCAERMSRLADDEGITGFMYVAAVHMLSQCWAHGEQLRRWHNLGTQIGSDGERANESGGVLNPALLNIR